jgi:arabinoxylan arabinofuranohydrolase
MIKKTAFFLPAILICFSLLAQQPIKQNSNTDPYPFNNPVITHMYTADAAPHVMPDGRVWMITSVDHEDGGGYSTMHRYHTFSSADMVNWIDHGEVLSIWDLLESDTEPEGEAWALWAPDMIYRNGLYYLYYPVRILHTDTVRPDGGRVVTSYIGVAVSDSPDKRFEVIKPWLEGTRGIDPAVFVDDDDEVYLYWGQHWGAKLKNNMIELATEPVRLDVGTDRFMEAIWMHKHNGQYFLSYHTTYNWELGLSKNNLDDPARKKSKLAWSVGNHPMGPFKYGGILNWEPGEGLALNGAPVHPEGNFVPWRLTLSNHGGKVEFHGQDYLFYHTSALSSWRQDAFRERGTWTQRSVCIDYIHYDNSGKIIPVQQTLESVQPVYIGQPFSIELDCSKAFVTEDIQLTSASIEVYTNSWVRFDNVNLGTGYYYFGALIRNTVTEGSIEIRKDSPTGTLLGTITIDKNSRVINHGQAETFLRGARGVHDIYLVFNIPENERLRIFYPRFFAGSPKQL